MGCVYLLTFPNGKVYVGITVKSAHERFTEHCRSRFPVGCAIRKYGSPKVVLSILSESDNCEHLARMESMFIGFYQSHSRGNGYNLTLGGEGVRGLDEESERQRRQSLSDYYSTDESRAECSVKGKMGYEAVKHRLNSPDVIAKRAARARVTLSTPEQRQANSDRVSAAWADPDKRGRMLAARSTPEIVAKKRAAQKEAQNTPEYRARHSMIMKEVAARRRAAKQGEAA